MASREKATNPYGQPYMKPDTAFPPREESGLSWLQMRQGLTLLWTPQRNPKIHVGSGEEP